MTDIVVTYRDVKDRVDIVDVVGSYIDLDRHGKGLCPFHPDTNPSLHVSRKKQIFKCFACGAGGDVFDFVERYHHVSKKQAFTIVAERAGFDFDGARTTHPEERERYLKYRKGKERKEKFDEWCLRWTTTIAGVLRMMDTINDENPKDPRVLHLAIANKSVLEYYWDILRDGTYEEKISLYEEKSEKWEKIKW